MKITRNSILFLSLLISSSITAQVVKIPVGKKVTISSEAKSTMGMTAMGQEIEIVSTTSTEGLMEFVSASADGYTLRNTSKRVKVAVNTMGNNQTFDSENPADKNNPAYAEMFKDLGKPVDMEIVGNKTKLNVLNPVKQSLNGLAETFVEAGRLVLNGMDLSKLVAGYKWEDSSTVADGFVMRTRYLVNKNDEKGIEVSVISDLQIKTTISQMGMDAKADFKGINTGKRLYNKNTGTLITEEADMDMTGELTIADQLMPVSFKNKFVTTVKD